MKFLIEEKETVVTHWIVEAKSEGEALNKTDKGDGEVSDVYNLFRQLIILKKIK